MKGMSIYMDKAPESAENYLESILMLSHSGNPVRSVDIANELNYSKPSVSIAMKNLKANGYITMENYGDITLTERGREIAQRIYDRHTLISDLLIFLGVDRETAVNDACKMEHGMSEKSFIALQEHIKTLKRNVYMQKPDRDDK